MWDFGLNTALLILVFLMQCWKISLHYSIKRLIEAQDRVVRENLQVQTSFMAVASEYVKGYHQLTVGTAKDAKDTMTTLAGEVKSTVAAGVVAQAEVASKLAQDSLTVNRGEVQ